MLGYDQDRIAELKRFQKDFEDLGLIGSGGFANVHKVRHLLENKLYALKIVQIKPNQLKESVEDYLYKLLSEAKTLAALHHPNVVSYNGCWIELRRFMPEELLQEPLQDTDDANEFEMVLLNEDSSDSSGFEFASHSDRPTHNSSAGKDTEYTQGHTSTPQLPNSSLKYLKQLNIYILTELCEQNLQTWIYRRNKQSKGRTPCEDGTSFSSCCVVRNYEIVMDIIAGLQYLHSKKIIHRDIKLQNIIMDSNGRCKIIDYGLAKKVRMWHSTHYHNAEQVPPNMNAEDVTELLSGSVGTKIFSSPEQASSEKYDHRTDIYSLAMVIIILFSDFTTAHEERELLYQIKSKNLTRVDIDEVLKEALVRCLGEEKGRPSLKELKEIVKKVAYAELLHSHRLLPHSQIEHRELISNLQANTSSPQQGQGQHPQDFLHGKGRYQYNIRDGKILGRFLSKKHVPAKQCGT